MTNEQPDLPDLSGYSREALERMLEAGREVVECHRVLARSGDNIVGELLRGYDNFFQWSHYPKGDVYDRETHSQYYYHAHPQDQRPGEHGHFHTFIRPKGMPPEIRPALVPDYKAPENPNDALSHLVAVSMDAKGFPIQMFSTNRWVTGEVWYVAEDVVALVDLFDIDHARPSWPVNRWITGMLALFRPQIVQLLAERDRVVAAWQEEHPDRDVYEDRELEVTSKVPVPIDEQIAHIQAALEGQGGPPG